MNVLQGTKAKKVAFGALLFLGLILFGAKSSFAAFGVSPPYVNAQHLVPGATYTQVIYLVQDQVDQDISVKANFNVQDPARQWISLDQGNVFVIPKGTRQFPVTVTIAVPKGAGLGVYSGKVDFVGAPAQAGQVTIALGVQVSINITVGNDIFRSFSAPYIKVLDVEEGWNPRVLVRLKNDGNVSESLDGATLELYDQFDAVRLAYIQLKDGLPQVPAFTAKEYTVDFPTDFHLGLGQYWGVITFYQNGQALGSEKGVFNVLTPGSLSSPLSIVWFSLRSYWIYYLLALVLLLLAGRRIWKTLGRRKGKFA